MADSRLPGFHRLPRTRRRRRLVDEGWLAAAESAQLHRWPSRELLDRLSENVVGGIALPLGVVTNVIINGTPRLVPMAIEEPSVVAACSFAARLAQAGGGVTAAPGERLIGAQVLVSTLLDSMEVRTFLDPHVEAFRQEADGRHRRVVKAGGGLRDIRYSVLKDDGRGLGAFLLRCNPGDSMGANYVNDVAEAFVGLLRRVAFPGTVIGAIVTNHPVGEGATASVRIPVPALARGSLTGEAVALRIESLSRWAECDPARRATHVKGILNGIFGVANALYQDNRALASTLWAHVPRRGEAIVTWRREDDHLVGRFAGPLACGTVGGTAAVVPQTQLFLRWLGVERAGELEAVLAAVGLLQNLAALRAIGTEGIQRGHMRLHARKNEEHHV